MRSWQPASQPGVSFGARCERPAGRGDCHRAGCFTGQHPIAPQAILDRGYLDEVFTGLRGAGLTVFHVVLDADDGTLRQRIHASDEAQAWRLAHLAAYRQSRTW